MDNQHKLIKGYRDLSQDEIDCINRVKALGESIGELIKELEDLNYSYTYPHKEDTVKVQIDMRWLSIGRTDLQTGISALVRSIAKPTNF